MPKFSLLSLNSFGIPFYVSTGRLRRMSAELNRITPTVICLQEIQHNFYLSVLTRELTAYSNFAFFRNRLAPKGGLFIALTPTCKVINSQFYPYPNQGKPFSIGFSDWWLNKGVLMVNLETYGHKSIVMNTHLQANYLADWRPTNLQTRIQLDQVKYLSELVNGQPKDASVIVCGDFNFPRHTLAYQQMVTLSGLSDMLINDPRPTYQPFPLVSAKWRTTLDFVFYRNPDGESFDLSTDILPIENTSVQNPIRRFLTDHHALLLNIESTPESGKINHHPL
jgi:Endonuclease/Exonuclease/phosphatase family